MAVAMTNEYEHWRQRAAREPTHAVSHFNWGWWAARNGRYEEAAAAPLASYSTLGMLRVMP